MGDSAVPVRPGGDTSTPNDDLKRLVSEYRLMFRYANAAGLAFDEKAQAALNAVGAAPEKASFADLMTAHGALAKLVAPATPLSLEATEPTVGPMGSLRRPTLVFWMIVVAIVAGIGFTWTEIYIQQAQSTTASSTQCQTSAAGGANPSASNPATSSTGSTSTPSGISLPQSQTSPAGGGNQSVSNPATNPTGSTPTPPGTGSSAGGQSQTPANKCETTVVSKAMIINWCFAAALGAVFYILFTVHQYVNNRTFDPRYNMVYLIRFVLGVLSGLIMAALIGQSSFAKSNAEIMSLGPAVLALLGGFSTEAVYQILQRMVDILVAAVKGDGADAAKAKAAQMGQNALLNLADDPSMPPDMKSKAIAAAKKIAN
jgi:hypothetical protein